MERKRQAEERTGTEIAATRVPQGDPGDPSQGPMRPSQGASRQARPGLLVPEDNRPPGRHVGARVPVAPRAAPVGPAGETARAPPKSEGGMANGEWLLVLRVYPIGYSPFAIHA